MSDYAMIIKRATHGDLRNFLRSHKSKISWKEKARILVNIAKSLNSLHKLDLVHQDFHCRNILVDDNMKIFIGDFGLSGPVNSKTDKNKPIEGVLPYIAPEVLRGNSYTKKSEIFSFGIIMWEMAFFIPPFKDRTHDVHLVVDILLKGLRPLIMSSIPKIYENIMKLCWHEDPSKRPDASQLIVILDEFIELSEDEPIDIIQPSLLFMQKKPDAEFSINQYNISKVDQDVAPPFQKSIKDENELVVAPPFQKSIKDENESR
ncbi:kinase-like domain-containing protein [Gigaspora rosea]|uniref:Kinase-like domain-containing protein n=1 Tax=Gigaspora rosea TaxID=44941 RepID=A0A397UEQ9_9GLOM|nr:kinase-like domain-containing protein [Gigaspora rosea]